MAGPLTTSNSFNYVDTSANVIFDACHKLGYLGAYETLQPPDYSLAQRSLNRIIKSLPPTYKFNGSVTTFRRQTGFCFLNANSGTYTLQAGQPYWCNAFVTTFSTGNNPLGNTHNIHVLSTANMAVNTVVGLMNDTGNLQYTTITAVNPVTNTINIAAPLVASMNSTSDVIYVITDGSSQPPQSIENIVLRDSGGNDTTVNIINKADWFNLPSKQAPDFVGDPVAVMYEQHLVGSQPFGYLNTDVAGAQDLTKYFVIDYVREIEDVTHENDVLAFPKEYYRALVYELAYDLSSDFNVPWTQANEKKRIEAIAAATGGTPDFVDMYFMPGNRGWNWNSNQGGPPSR